MWYTIDQNGFRWDELINIYRISDSRERSYREDLFRFTNFYSAVCYAILGVTLSGFVSLHSKGPIVLALLFGPVLTFFMCILGLRVTGRIYQRIVEEISTKAKLENLLGFDKPLAVSQFMGKEAIWPQDDCILPPRHAARRMREQSSAEFIATSAKGGFYRDNRMYFGLIKIFAVLLAITIIVTAIASK
jgi:hypothetical protein